MVAKSDNPSRKLALSPAIERALDSIVTLQAEIPEDAFTAPILGEKRAGSGIVIRDSGLVVTIGYLVTEAESVWLTSADGKVTPAHALGVDQETGFGLVQALGPLGLPALELGHSHEAKVGDAVVLAAGGRRNAVEATILSKQEFAGYWEYALDEAIYTAPAHPLWGGAGLIDMQGRLIGVGSLHVEQGGDALPARDLNMVVPIDLLAPVIEDLTTSGRLRRPARPWLGVYSAESEGRVVIANVADQGPAAEAGLKRGDVIVAVGEARVGTLRDFYRRIWSRGPAGVEVPLAIERDGRLIRLRLTSADRTSFFRKPRLQ